MRFKEMGVTDCRWNNRLKSGQVPQDLMMGFQILFGAWVGGSQSAQNFTSKKYQHTHCRL